MDTAAPSSFRHDAKVIGLVASAHCVSHFLQLALPPLFVFLKRDFDVSYAALGALMSVFYAGSAVCQLAAGFAVDRFGARPVLFGGMACLAGGVLLASVAPGFVWLLPLAAVMGVGNGVFHPADFAILNARVARTRLGHAFSMHGVGGSLGYALAPICSYALASALGWRSAVLAMGLVALAVLAVLAMYGQALATEGHHGRARRDAWSGRAMLRDPAIALCFAYFCVYTTSTIGIQTFAAPALNAAFGVSMVIATSAVTGYLMGGTAGIVAGGFLAARTHRHDRVAAMGLAVGAAVILVVATGSPSNPWLLPLFVAAGFALGATGPSRDMIVRNATPPGAAGRTYGVVYSGLDLGATLAPVLAGTLLDHGAPRAYFLGVVMLLLVAVTTVIQVRRGDRGRAAGGAAAD